MNPATVILAEGGGSGMSFMIRHLVDFELFGQKLSITTTHIAIVIVDLILILFALAVYIRFKHPQDVPGPFQTLAEFLVEFIGNFVSDNMGPKNGKRFLNYTGSIFLFILLSNISGLLGLRPPTADYGVTLPLGLLTCFLIHFNGMRSKKFGYVKAYFEPIPLFLPMNVISEISTPISLSLRLFGNVMSGTVMMGLWYSLMPVFARLGVPSFLHIYFDLFSGAIQTYVFCMLTTIFIQDKMGDPE